jgi:Bax protein
MKYLSYILFIVLFFASCEDIKKVTLIKDINDPNKYIKKVKVKENFVTIIHTISQDYQKSQNKKPNITVRQKKENFKKLLIPAIDTVYDELNTLYFSTMNKIDTNTSIDEISKLKKYYKAKSNQELLQKLKPHPKSIALAQAAIESSWATSRFFKEANNIFGVWSFSKNEPRIAAGQTRGKTTIWLKKYPNIASSIRDYFKVIAKGYAYDEFRILKMTTNNPYVLVQKLHKYSEKGFQYSQELSKIIRYNKFENYDR